MNKDDLACCIHPRQDTTGLTPREVEVLGLVQRGCSNKEISRSLGMGIHTAREHVSNIKKKTGVASVIALNPLDTLSDVDWHHLIALCALAISPTEARVLRHLCKGNSSKRIGQLMRVSPRTVDKHRQHLLAKSALSSTRQLIAWVTGQYAMCGVDRPGAARRDWALSGDPREQTLLMTEWNPESRKMTKEARTSAQHQANLEDQIKTKNLEKQLGALNPGKLASLATTAGQVTAAIDAGTDVINSVIGLKDAVTNLYKAFEGAKDFKERSRSLELIVVNATSRRLVWEGSFFDSGTTFGGPMPVNVVPVEVQKPVGATLWTVANAQGSILTGVSGAGKWRIEGSKFALLVGFTNPQIGACKSEIAVVERDAEVRLAYDACDNVEAKQHDLAGYTVSVYADEAKIGGGRRFVFSIVETPHETNPDRGATLKAGEYLTPGQFLTSPNGRFVATYQAARGNLVVNDLNAINKVIWSSGTSTRDAWRCGLDEHGAFSVFEAQGRAVWTAPKEAVGGYVQLADDGSLGLYDAAKSKVWTSK